jgi:hypothetical protein
VRMHSGAETKRSPRSCVRSCLAFTLILRSSRACIHPGLVILGVLHSFRSCVRPNLAFVPILRSCVRSCVCALVRVGESVNPVMSESVNPILRTIIRNIHRIQSQRGAKEQLLCEPRL